LHHGQYTLEVYAQDLITGAKSTMQRIDFDIPTAWWQTWWFFLLVFLFINGGILGLAYLHFQRKRKKQLLKEQLWISQLKALRAQMNPHFLYNILNTVQGLVYSNRKKEAGQLLGNFSNLMRKSLQTSENAYILLREELEILQLYLMLEKARFDETFQYDLKQEAISEYLHFKIPSMLIQPFVENALKHGLLHKKGEKHLEILFAMQENALKVTIEDNGIGRRASAEINQRHKHTSTNFATRATAQRIELLNLYKKKTVMWHIHDKIDENNEPQGTKVELIIPLEM
jgi:LytS/YehU family sensor histidine kinase